MLSKTLSAIFVRDLTKLKEELNLYSFEQDLWKTDAMIANSAGNLALHLVGNLNHFVGAVVGKTGYVRQREMEFTLKNIPRKKIIEDIDAVIIMLPQVLSSITDEVMSTDFPVKKHDETVTYEQMLVHLYGHLAYHLGQVNYHRRLLSK
jgi:uncharacterized damage-inducible protein DinB